MDFTPQQKQQILKGFADFKAKQGAKRIIREASPSQGYWIDNEWFSDETILAPFKNAYAKLKADNAESA